jgi:hypothetical protein
MRILTILASTCLILTAFSFQTSSHATGTTVLNFDPPLAIVQIDQTFSINITIDQVMDLCSWEFRLYFKNDVLEATAYEEGPFLRSGGPTFLWPQSFTNNYNATHGQAWLACVSMWQGPGVNGSGVLATITFKAKNWGTSRLNLRNTYLYNSAYQPIDHTAVDGTVQAGIHDVAIKNVNPLKTIVGQNWTMCINVVAENQGNYTENFNVTAYANTTQIATQEVTLNSGENTTITYLWSTIGIPKGNYIINASATTVQYETDTADNTKTADSQVKVGVRGDLNDDNKCNILDLVKLSGKFGAERGDPHSPPAPKYDPNYDFNDDNKINILDLVKVAIYFGETDP